MAYLKPGEGSVQRGLRPVVIIQNDKGNEYSPTTIVAPVTSQKHKKDIRTHVNVNQLEGLKKESIVLCEQIRTIDKMQLRKYIGMLGNKEIKELDEAIRASILTYQARERSQYER